MVQGELVTMAKILIIGYFNYPFQQASAVYVSRLRDILVELGNEVTILDKNRVIYKSCYDYLIPVNSINSEIDDYFQYGKIKHYITDEYSTILLYNFSAYESFRILKFARKHGIKVGAISTEWKEWKTLNLGKAAVKIFDVFFRMRIANKKMDYNIVCSDFFMNYYKDYNPIYIPTLTGKGLKRNRVDRGKGKIRLIYIGMPAKKKENLSKFISALVASSKCENYEFELYGLTRYDYQRIFDDKNDLDKFPNIHFMGRVSQEEISKALQNSDYSVIFRENNRTNRAGFPTKMGTSLSNGVPVLATAVGDIPRYIDDGHNGYILPQDSKSLVLFLDHLPDLAMPEVDCDTLFWKHYIVNMEEMFRR